MMMGRWHRAYRLDRAVKSVTSPYERRLIDSAGHLRKSTRVIIIEAFNRAP